jgi:phosphoribosylamine--glycine ligase
MAAKGYPGAYQKGSVIKGLDNLPQDSFHMVFHAGTAGHDGQITSSGGRVLNITARASTLAKAHQKAYAMAHNVAWEDGFYRSDIGWRAL